MTDAQVIANFDTAQAEHIAASKAYATRNVGSMELLVLAETWRRDPDLAMRIAEASAHEQTPTIKLDEAQNG